MAENDTHYNQTPADTDDASAADYGLTTPVAPEGGRPVDPGNMNGNSNGGMNGSASTPVIPLPGIGEGGAVNSGGSGSGSANIPMIPLPAPGEGGAVDSGGINTSYWPIYPNLTPAVTPPTGYYGRVRFLNASTNNFPVNISVDNSAYAINSRFGTISTYDWISDGFHTITVRRATGLRTILLQQTFPFVSGEKVTMVLTDSAQGGLEFVRISDTGCTNLPYNSGCYRFANMTYSGSRYDLRLYGGETIFRNIAFQNVTSYKQAVAGSYQFYVTTSGSYSVIRELPVIIIGATIPGIGSGEVLVSFTADIQAGKNYTSYIIGNNWSDMSIRVLTVED